MNIDNEQFWRLLEPFHPRAESFCRRLTGDPDNGDDLYQEAILRAFRKFTSLKDSAVFRAWLYRIILNTYKSWHRNNKRRMILNNYLDANDAGLDPTNLYEARILLKWAFSSLSADEKALVTFYELEGWSINEIADLLKKPEGTIKSHLFRARKKMRNAIAERLALVKKNEGLGYELPQSQIGNIQG